MSGARLNFLAQGHRVLHPAAGRAPNVFLLDLELEEGFLPRHYYRYLPSLSYESTDRLRLLAVLSAVELADDAELFLDYWDVFACREGRAPDWMVLPPLPDNPFLVKKHYEGNGALLRFFARRSLVPAQFFEKIDVERMLAKRVEALVGAEGSLPREEGEAKRLQRD